MTLTVAVLGTGIMGAGMARSLAREGHSVRVWNRDRAKAEAVSAELAGALFDAIAVADSPAEAVAGADVVITMLFDLAATESVMAEALPAVTGTWVQSATVGLPGALALAGAAEQAGVPHVDAPVLGTRAPAEQGKLTVLAGGSPSDPVTTVFDAIGARTVWVGPTPGDGHRLKLTTNAWVVSLTAATAQSVELATGLGIDPALFLDVIAGGPLDSGYAQAKGAAMVAGEYPTSFGLDGAVKDSTLIAEALAGAGKDNRLMAAVNHLYATAAERGHAGDDMAAVNRGF
ncbi:NAD(P)-dependent oxidoreductase [Actinokineospora pegani]|uniref:NAD(P)-dependent oxidoreductase n=1 Tax=Actinokineospora pegani TaxID=2654637 RepID=UPI0012EA124F|nr:NAD(P)-dependent oxidoreductase [Actinokineospora pegani]